MGRKMLEAQLLFELVLDVETQPQPQRPGNGPAGKRQIFAVTGGHFDGPRLRGTVLPDGGGWHVSRPMGSVNWMSE
ncbi:MAG: hypothetical protein ACI8PT_003451 [Gammaproteobacteria bacterium]|jgi:hypothetical protein